MTVHNRLGWIDCTDGNAATALMQAVQLPWVIQKWDAENALQALSERQPDREFNRNLTQLAKVIAARGSSSREIERPSSTFPGQSDAGGNSPGVVDLIAETMRRDYARELRAGDLAQSLKMSRFQFCRLFKRSFGCSFRTYLTRLRIGSACRLLSKSGGAASVTEVGLAVGFQDASYFARMFRQATGESPSTYARTAVKPTDPEASVFEEADDMDEYISGQTELFAATGSDY